MKKKDLTLRDFIDIPDKNIYESAEYFQKFINQLDKNRSYAFDTTSTTAVDTRMNIIDRYSGQEIKTTSFVSSNYLGLNRHPAVLESAQKAMEKYGIGTCTSPIIGGYTDIHAELERKIAELHGQEDAILFTSGYSANIGTFQLLLNKFDIAIVDMFVHASVFDGLGNTNIKMFRHNDMEYLEKTLKINKGNFRNMAIIIDGVYSQDGDLPKLKEISDLAKQYGAFVFMDDAHGVGVMGDYGKGTASYFKVEKSIDITTGTLSKAIGALGGYATGSKQLIKYMRHYSRSNTFSAAIAPPLVAAASKSLDIFTEEPFIRKKLWDNTYYIKNKLTSSGFDIGKSESPIIPVMVRDDIKVMQVAKELKKRGIFIIPAIYPAVKLRDSRLRLNVSANHSIEDLDYFCQVLIDINKMLNFVN